VSPAVLLARRRDEEIPEVPVEITLSLVYHLCERSVRRPRRPGRLSTAGLRAPRASGRDTSRRLGWSDRGCAAGPLRSPRSL